MARTYSNSACNWITCGAQVLLGIVRQVIVGTISIGQGISICDKLDEESVYISQTCGQTVPFRIKVEALGGSALQRRVPLATPNSRYLLRIASDSERTPSRIRGAGVRWPIRFGPDRLEGIIRVSDLPISNRTII